MYETALLPSAEVLQDFWGDFRQQSHNQGHSVHEIPECDLGRTSAVVIHIDGVRVFKSSGHNVEHLVYSFSSPVVRGSAFRTKFVICQIPTWQMSKDTNMWIVSFITWLLKQLRSGHEPRKGFHGELRKPMEEPLREFPKTAFVGTKHDDKEKVHQHRYEPVGSVGLVTETSDKKLRSGFSTGSCDFGAPKLAPRIPTRSSDSTRI